MRAARAAAPVLGAIALVALGWLSWSWFRDSSLVRVRHVEVSGLTTADAPAIRRELTESAKGMTTLHVGKRGLERAVSGYPIVHSISASSHFPSTLEINVHEYEPIAVLAVPGSSGTSPGKAVPVAFDGTLLPRIAKATLPAVAVAVASAPPSNGFPTPRVKRLVAVLAGAPRALRPELERAYLGTEGIRVAMRDGPTLEFGTRGRLAAKWAAATRVLAARSSKGATTIDVRLPERPAASGFGSDSTNADAASSNPQL
jgi:cell division septal protein FtsQ